MTGSNGVYNRSVPEGALLRIKLRRAKGKRVKIPHSAATVTPALDRRSPNTISGVRISRARGNLYVEQRPFV